MDAFYFVATLIGAFLVRFYNPLMTAYLLYYLIINNVHCISRYHFKIDFDGKKIWNVTFQFKSNILDCKLIKISENSDKILKKKERYKLILVKFKNIKMKTKLYKRINRKKTKFFWIFFCKISISVEWNDVEIS